MRRLPTALTSASAAALMTVAITVAVPAIADDGGDAGDAKDAGGLAACLRDHGLPGAPGGPELKSWLRPRLERGDAVVKDAMAACGPKSKRVEVSGPSEQDLRACLTTHGITLPAGDGGVLKDWLAQHGDDAANRGAMKACHFEPPRKVTTSGPCAAPARGEKPAGPPPGKPATAN